MNQITFSSVLNFKKIRKSMDNVVVQVHVLLIRGLSNTTLMTITVMFCIFINSNNNLK